MFFSDKELRAAAGMALAGLLLTGVVSVRVAAQQPAPPIAELAATEPSSIALPLPEDRGAAALEQSLRRLSTTASLLMIVAHPDDEDGALLTYLSRGLGVRCTLLTLTRGEGGQNAMSADSYDALGLLRTNELLKAGEYYGAKQLWGTEIDFGFSKTQEEAFARWGHDRVLYDAVLAVRRERPQVIVSTFVGGVTDGHGHHQVSGEIAQEAFKAAADPTVFPEQLKPVSEGGLGLTVWQPLAVYGMVPFAPVKDDKGCSTTPLANGRRRKFRNYATGEWIYRRPPTDVKIAGGHARSGPRPKLCADRPRRLGRAEVAERWGESHAQRPGGYALPLVGRGPRKPLPNPAQSRPTATCSTTAGSASTPPSPASHAW